MEANPNFSDTEVTERPQEEVIKGDVVKVVKGERKELYEGLNEDNLQYGSMDDELIQLQVEVEYKGRTIPVTVDFRYYEEPSDRSTFGQYIQRNDAPERGQTIDMGFDEEGNAELPF